jgi:hypothetical protein
VFAVLPATDAWATVRGIPNANSGHGPSVGGKVILHSPRHSDPYDRLTPRLFRPDDPQRLAFSLGVLADLDYRKVAVKQLHFGFRVFAVTDKDNG